MGDAQLTPTRTVSTGGEEKDDGKFSGKSHLVLLPMEFGAQSDSQGTLRRSAEYTPEKFSTGNDVQPSNSRRDAAPD